MAYARTTYGVILAGTLLWCAGLVLAPACTVAGGELVPVGKALFGLYQPICHQIPERSIPILGSVMGVCARCSAIYFAFLAGVLLYPFFRRLRLLTAPSRALLAIAALPMIVDAVWPGPVLYEVTNLSRVVTGGWFGLLLPFVILPIAIQAVHELVHGSTQPPPLEKGPIDAQ